MSFSGNEFVSLLDLGMAYRKTKVDLFYSPRLCNLEILEYEKNLEKNLLELKKKINSGQAPDCGVASWTLVPKQIELEKMDHNLIFSDPLKQWKYFISDLERNSKDKPIAEFRVMEKLPIEFHVFSTLWIQKVGHLFEKKISDVAYGNRLRRTSKGDINQLSHGSLIPYLYPYCKWRDDGISTMQKALEQETNIVAITADVSGFYHNLNIEFMLNKDFQKAIDVKLDDKQEILHKLFIDALAEWAGNTPPKRGLPVGLTASSIIANLALFELDEIIQSEIVPLHYGRYVDDIIMVMKNSSNFGRSEEVWDWIIKRSNGSLQWYEKNGKKSIRFSQSYLTNSDILFTNKKNRIFILSGETGLTTVIAIRRQIQERASEWRELPDISDEREDIESGILSVIKTDGEDAESFHKADKLSIRRAGFALKLRDIEAYARALPREAWENERHSFFDAFIKHVLVLPVFFDFYPYLSRVIQLAVSCCDFEHLHAIIDELACILDQLNDCTLEVKAKSESADFSSGSIKAIFQNELRIRISQSIEVSFPFALNSTQKQKWNEFILHRHGLFDKQSIDSLYKKCKSLFERDLAYLPFRQIVLPKELTGLSTTCLLQKNHLVNFPEKIAIKSLKKEIVIGINSICKIANLKQMSGLPFGFLFATRPLGLNELYLIHASPFQEEGQKELAACILAMRGFTPEKSLPGKDEEGSIKIPYGKPKDKISIAVANWKTDDISWESSVGGDPDLDAKRYSRINKLLNEVIRSRNRPDYLILPELSLPPRWFLAVARKLQKKGISLISGIEYQHGSSGNVKNQIWAALSYDGLGFPAMIVYRQDKQQAAPSEEKELKALSNIILKPETPWESPPVLSHADFHFACLLCSELTNIAYRSSVRGKIDALFVPEWNKDTDSFNSLVESAALDVHAYIIQCNNGQFGDSRIRAPYKDSWKRDIIRIKGGINDYFVIGEIDIKSLRQFQSCYRSPELPFKPVPDGFIIAKARETLPKG